ncbi:MAG: hypothetical protein E6094_05625 [Clostridium perfringens]|nr:hypothetical protein [Clostridium perfringens]
MKYTIHGLQQDKLIEMGLDNDDALILAVIKEMYSSKKMEYQIIDGERFIWIDQGYLLEQIPIIGTQRKLKMRLKSYCEKGLLERRLLHVKNGVKGKYSYINITAYLDRLSEFEPWEKISQGLGKDTPIRDSINNISKDILCSTTVQRLIEKWNSLGLSTNLKTINQGTERYRMLKTRIKQYSEEEIFRAIEEIPKSDFLMGRITNFEITFDWFIRPNNFPKVLEGNYGDKKTNGGTSNGGFKQDNSKGETTEQRYDYGKIMGI